MLSIDETALSQGELYTIVSNKEPYNVKGTMVAIVHGTKTEDVIAVRENIPKRERDKVDEITLEMANSMHKIARTFFYNSKVEIDRFHVQKLSLEAVHEKANTPAMAGHRRGQQAEERCKRRAERCTTPRLWTTGTRGENS